MLKVTIPASEDYDPIHNLFIQHKEQTLTLEHSLVSLSKWEQKFKKPFLSTDSKTTEETLAYIKYMTITPNVPDEIYYRLPGSVMSQINDYISDPATATTFSDRSGKKTNKEIITAELIYYWMIALNIPFECQKWHLNRLLTLIRVCGIKNNPDKKMSKNELLSQNRSLNAARRKALGTKG